MSIISKLTLRTLCKNPKRTIVTIVGIIMATAMLTAVANLLESFRASYVQYAKESEGDYHCFFEGVSGEDLKYFQNNINLEKIGVSKEVGYALFEESINPDKPYLYLLAMNEECIEILPFQLMSGRWPERDDEIVISNHMRTNGGSDLTTGDKVTLQLGVRERGDGSIARQDIGYRKDEETFLPFGEKTYTVVGVMPRPAYSVEYYSAPGYTAITVPGAADDADWVNIYARYTKAGLKSEPKVTETLMSLTYKGHAVRVNTELMQWETLRFRDEGLMLLLYGMGGFAVAIILVTSVFCIRNSFQISLTEKMRLYGMLSSVGTTSKQRKQMVFSEAFYLGIIGIPLGVGSGVLATFILVKVCSGMTKAGLGMQFVYAFSWPVILAGTLLAILTIYFSALQSARKASKISPISAIRSQETIRRGRRKLHVPAVITKIFGIGGTLAYKNRKRSRVKYRTTVVSIAVSVTVFIAMNTFIRLGFSEAADRYEKEAFPIVVSLYDADPRVRERQADYLSAMEGVQEYVQASRCYVSLFAENLNFTKEYEKSTEETGVHIAHESPEGEFVLSMCLLALSQDAYEAYCREVGVAPGEAAEGVIVGAEYSYVAERGSFSQDGEKGGRSKIYEGTVAEFAKGSLLELKARGTIDGEKAEKTLSVPVVCQTKKAPEILGKNAKQVFGVVSREWLEENLADCIYEGMSVYIRCEDADALEQRIRSEIQMKKYTVTNYDRIIKTDRSRWLLVAIFLYGFITVISLIGITNIFNTVTTNMELRSREFAMLKSVGMTDREFGRMVRLESIFYGGEALLFGIPAGCVLSWVFYHIMGNIRTIPYALPVTAILICVGAVAVLLFVITRYSMGKINRKNIIETIQNENI